MKDAVDLALPNVSYDAYVKRPDGTLVPQSSSPKIIAAMLRLLDIQPGMRILEVGTGSGYSTALLAHLVGESGCVLSLDVDSELVGRAAGLLSSQGFNWVTIVTRDGREGYPPAAPFDRVVVWATGEILPAAWVEQVRPGGVIVAPIRLLSLANTTTVVRVSLDKDGTPVGEKLIPGGFVRLSDRASYQWRGYAEEADLAVLENDRPVAWVSAEWLRSEEVVKHKPEFLRLLLSASRRDSSVSENEEVEALRAYLLATNPQGLTTASIERIGFGGAIGCSQPGSLALLNQFGEGYAEAGESAAAATLNRWISDWRAAGRPGFKQLRVVVERTLSGWKIKASL